MRASTLAPPANPGAAGGFCQGPASAQSRGGYQGTAHEAQQLNDQRYRRWGGISSVTLLAKPRAPATSESPFPPRAIYRPRRASCVARGRRRYQTGPLTRSIAFVPSMSTSPCSLILGPACVIVDRCSVLRWGKDVFVFFILFCVCVLFVCCVIICSWLKRCSPRRV